MRQLRVCGCRTESSDKCGDLKRHDLTEVKIKTPYGVKNWPFIKRLFDNHVPAISALKQYRDFLEDEYSGFGGSDLSGGEIKKIENLIDKLEGKQP